jgi:hypothetical protein
VRCALQDPASVAALLITTEAMVAELLCDACSGGMGGKRGVAGDQVRAALSASVEECRAQKLQTHETPHYRGICASRRWLPL